MIENVEECTPQEIQRQIDYLAATPVAVIASLLRNGQCKLSKGVVRFVAKLGSMKTEFGDLGNSKAPATEGQKKFRVSEVLPTLKKDLSHDKSLRKRVESFLAKDEADIEYNTTIMREGDELIMKDGNARSIAFYERRRNGAEDEIEYPVFLVDWV